jgi:putative FmdB family regulatory protein
MPIYDYRCDHCGHAFSAIQSFKDEALGVCPNCGLKPRRLLVPPALVFKGSGWYVTDNRKSGGDKAESGEGGDRGDRGDKAATADKSGTGKSDKGVKGGESAGGGEGGSGGGKAPAKAAGASSKGEGGSSKSEPAS